jgi:hypothetical protein
MICSSSREKRMREALIADTERISGLARLELETLRGDGASSSH